MFRVLLYVYSIHATVIVAQKFGIGSQPTPVSSLTNSTATLCTLSIDPEVTTDLRHILDKGNTLIVVQLLPGNRTAWQYGDGDIFDPYTWVRVRNKKGRGLLWLRAEFEMLSLTTLSYGVSDLNIKVTESSPGCVANQTMLSELVKNAVFNDFLMSGNGDSSTWTPDEDLCNVRMRATWSGADTYYVCCHRNTRGNVVCEELMHDMWITILLTCVVLLNIVVIMYMPLVVPSHLYRASRGFIPYQHKLATDFRLRVMKTRHPPDPSEEATNVVPRSSLTTAPSLAALVEQIDEDKSYELPLKAIHFLVPRGRLIPENYVPVGILRTLYDTILRCKISRRTSLEKCCRSRLFGPVIKHRCNMSWYKCLQYCMDLIILVVIVCPWIVRVVAYLFFEYRNQMVYQMAAISRGLGMGFRGSFTLMLTPLHVLFLVCYSLIIVDILLLGLLREALTENFVFVLKQCFRDMRERSSMRAIGWCSRVLLKPCEKCGILAFVIVPLYWLVTLPIVVCVLLFYLFPTINLTIRFIIHLFIHILPSRKKKHTRSTFVRNFMELFEIDFLVQKENLDYAGRLTFKRRGMQVFILLVCLLTMYSTIFLVTECITFFVEVGVYTIIGIILNASHTMQYVSLIFMLFLYGKDCFGRVTETYLVFNKTMIATVMAKADAEVRKVSWQSEDQQKNTAFQLKSEIPKSRNQTLVSMTPLASGALPAGVINPDRPLLVVKDNSLKWKLRRLVLFLNKKDTAFITNKFFFDTSKMPCSGSPGPLLNNLMSAIAGFMVIIVFLMFVLLVVITFGDMNDVSTSNQTLATLAGGFLPWVFRNILFKGAADLTVDTSNLNFQGCFANVLERYCQTWPFSDIDAKSTTVQASGEGGASGEVGASEEGGAVEMRNVSTGDGVGADSHGPERQTLITGARIGDSWLTRVREVSNLSSAEHDLIVDISKKPMKFL